MTAWSPSPPTLTTIYKTWIPASTCQLDKLTAYSRKKDLGDHSHNLDQAANALIKVNHQSSLLFNRKR
jgi:hypothetical protein